MGRAEFVILYWGADRGLNGAPVHTSGIGNMHFRFRGQSGPG